ncbi:MAG: sulfotransferase domain-containing protein, partial [SAR324 cluster bacterium]|nr:sulfotransferase domain-containing protein [SAR324 cluster bacterium]
STGLRTPRYFNYRESHKSLKIGKFDPDAVEDNIGIGAFSPYYVNQVTFRFWLNNVQKGRYIQGHIPWTPGITPVITDLAYHHLVIIRDPRAVVASLLPFILDAWKTGMGSHFLEADFKTMSPIQRLNFILEGGYAPLAKVEIKSFAEVYRSMLAWRNQPNSLFMRFEDLVGEQGGGDIDQQKITVEKIASFLRIPFDKEVENRLKTVYDTSSRTFRTGKIDGWKTSMDSEIVDHLNKSCEALCNEAGYQLT